MESGKQKRKWKREKLTCLECKRSFDDDYRHEHNKKYHDNLLKAGKSIAYKVAGLQQTHLSWLHKYIVKSKVKKIF